VSAIETVRRFARATNLTVAGRRFAVAGDGDDAEALRLILRGLGGREARAGHRVDHLWCTAAGHSVRAIREAAAGQPGVTLVAVDAGAGLPALDISALGQAHAARPGVLALDEMPDVFVVPFTDSPAEAASGVSAIESGDVTSDATRAVADARARIAWARRFMPVTASLAEFGDGPGLYGLRIALSMVLEPKTAVLALLMRDAGAVVDVYAHADETDDAVAETLRDEGLDVFASSTATLDASRALALALLDRRPDILIDDGSHVIRLAHEQRPALLPTMIGAAEETTSGLRPLRAMESRGELRLPVIAVNDAPTKTYFDNRYGTGQSCVFAILDVASSAPKKVRKRLGAGRTAVVAGFGPVGAGVAQALTAAGLRVVISEIDPVRALQAAFAGYDVGPLVDAVATADLVVSATGVRDTISLGVLRACADGALIAVAGGVDHEVALDDALAAGAALTPLSSKLDRVDLPATPKPGTRTDTADAAVDTADAAEARRRVVLLDRGGCINITAGEGNPIEIMDLSFAVQLAALRTLLDAHGRLLPGVHPVGAAADARIAAEALRALGVEDEAGGERDPDPEPSDPEPSDPASLAPVDTRTTRFGPPA
jgi:adenosylhomocysteinase